MSIEVNNESGVEVDEAEVAALARHVLDAMRVHPQAELSVVMVDEPAMEQLHVQWMDEPGPTDVLSFPMDELRPGKEGEEPEPGLLGDVVLCPQVAKKQARAAGHSAEEELLLLTTHGILHLLGYDHAEPEEEKEMFGLQRKLLLTFLSTRGPRDVTALILVAAALTLVAGLAAASEAALSRIGRTHAAELVTAGRPGAQALARVAADPAPVLSVATLLRVTSEAGACVAVTLLAAGQLGVGWRAGLVAGGVMAAVSFVAVGVGPRTLGRLYAEPVALRVAPGLGALTRVLGPLTRLLVMIGNAITPGRGLRDGPFASEAELRHVVDLAQETEVIEAGERKMIQSVIDLGDTLTREVMVPRTDVVSVDRDTTLHRAMSLFLRSGFSRVPVVGEGHDDVVGILYLKDVARRLHEDPGAGGGQRVEAIMRRPVFVPDSKPVDALLREMQHAGHAAVVVDEYGGTAGLVTIEDILEEIVGEIADEYDHDDPEVEAVGDGRWRVSSRLHLSDLGELFGMDVEDEEVDTVGGLLSKALGRVPITGATAVAHGLELVAERFEGRRHHLATVLVRRAPLEERRPEEPDQTAERSRG